MKKLLLATFLFTAGVLTSVNAQAQRTVQNVPPQVEKTFMEIYLSSQYANVEPVSTSSVFGFIDGKPVYVIEWYFANSSIQAFISPKGELIVLNL